MRVVCLPGVEANGRLDLAAVGAGARRATEDSSTVAYIGPLDRAATRFSQPILESAHIAQLSARSGTAAMARLLRAIGRSEGAESPREAVAAALAG